MTIKYRITVIESERGWGQESWTEDFDTYEEARERINSINSENTASRAPDWYMIAQTKIEAVEIV